MDNERFERELLRLAFETDVRITVATVAYTFGIPSRDARAKLDSLIDSGLLELDSDRDGNLFYKLHQDAGSKNAGRIEEILASCNYNKDVDLGHENDSHLHRPSINETISYNPKLETEPTPEVAPQPQVQVGVAAPSEPRTVFADPRPVEPTNRRGWTAGQHYGRTSAGVRGYRPDATVNHCGTSSFVVAEGASCDSRAAGHQQPRSASCDEYPPQINPYNAPLSPQEAYQRKQQIEANAPAVYEPSQQELYAQEDPVHHPAVAVILSLILPGAGQFYNGQIEKGVFMMLMTFLSWMALFGWAFQLWSIFDALIVASRIRSAQEERKYLEYQKTEEPRRAITSNRRF